MGGHHQRQAELAGELRQQPLDAPHVHGVQPGEGLVAQHDLRVGDDGPRQGRAP